MFVKIIALHKANFYINIQIKRFSLVLKITITFSSNNTYLAIKKLNLLLKF